MTKVTLADVGSLIDATTAQTTINNNSAAIVTAVENTLSRDGTSPNQMESDLDMNSNRILNLPIPVQDSEPIRLGDLTDFTQFQNSVDLSAAVASATASAATATTQAGNANNSAIAASAFASAASASAAAAALSVTPMKKPEDYGAIGDGTTDDKLALQAWAAALSDGGIGYAGSIAGYATSGTVQFMPTTNLAPVTGPTVFGNLKLIGHASLPIDTDLLQIWNPTSVGPTQNFYSPRFDSIEVSNTTGTGSGVSVRGYWGSIKRIFGRDVYNVVVLPNFLFGGIPDTYESMCNLGDITGVAHRGWVLDNQIGLGASITCNNVRGTVSSFLVPQLGCVNCTGSFYQTGCFSYSGPGTAMVLSKPAVPAIQNGPHEFYTAGWGDIDVVQYGYDIKEAEFARFSGHRFNVEPPGFAGIGPSWPLKAYQFGRSTVDGRLINVEVDTYITIRPGVTAGNIGTLFDFNNDPNIDNLTLYANISDQTGILGTTLLFAGIYKNINANARIKIIQNGTVVYNTMDVFNFAQLPAAQLGLRGQRYCVRDSAVTTLGSVITGGSSNVVGALCNGTNWVVG